MMMSFPFQSIDESTFRKMMAENASLQILDVRTPEEYLYLGHVPGSILIPIHQLPHRWHELNPNLDTVVLCQHGVRSIEAAYYLKDLGFSTLYNLQDGLSLWDGPLAKEEPLSPTIEPVA